MALTIEDGRNQVVEKAWPQKHEVHWGEHRWEVGHRLVRVSYQTKAPLVRRTLKCERRGLKDKTTMNDGRKNVDAELVAVRQAKVADAGRGLCRSDRRLPLCGVSPADTGAVPRSAGQVGCMATDGNGLPTISTTMKLGTNATNSNTNKPNKDHPVPLGATQGHTKYHQKASNFDLHTPRTKAAGGRRRIAAATISSICVVDAAPEPGGARHVCPYVIRPFHGGRRSVDGLEAAPAGLFGRGQSSVALEFGGQ